MTCTSPDGNITAELRAGEPRQLSFRPAAYESYTESALAHQLSRLGELLYVGHERAVRRVMDDVGLHRPTDPAEARDETQRRFLQELRKISATGKGPQGLVRFEVAGMASWHCEITTGTLHQLTEPEFVAEATAAGRELLRASRYEKALLKNEFYGARHAPPVKERIRRRAAG
ncbi:MAG TPA: hypothetical protein VIL37_03780 [Natronosporangium sp.]